VHEVPEEILQQRELEIKNIKENTNTIEVWKILARAKLSAMLILDNSCFKFFFSGAYNSS